MSGALRSLACSTIRASFSPTTTPILPPRKLKSSAAIATGARFTVIDNHLKSKGSECDDVGDPDAGDGQGNCNRTRDLAAAALLDWIASDPTGSGDTDFLVLGDFNAYAQEDPIRTLVAFGQCLAVTTQFDLMSEPVQPPTYTRKE